MTLTNKMKEMRRQERGFTIVELLIVIVVIAILAALVITSYLGIQARARDSERESDIRNIAVAVQAYATVNEGSYPTCAEIGDGTTVADIDPQSLIPPRNGTFNDEGASNGVDVYGCESDGNGVQLSYSLEQLPNNASNPMTRDIGDVSGL